MSKDFLKHEKEIYNEGDSDICLLCFIRFILKNNFHVIRKNQIEQHSTEYINI